MSSRPAWSTERVLRKTMLYRDCLRGKKGKEGRKEKKEKRKKKEKERRGSEGRQADKQILSLHLLYDGSEQGILCFQVSGNADRQRLSNWSLLCLSGRSWYMGLKSVCKYTKY